MIAWTAAEVADAAGARLVGLARNETAAG